VDGCINLDKQFLTGKDKLDDQAFALDLLENHHVLVAPGSSFNTPYTDHFRITSLPDTETINLVFDRIHACLESYA
jgi:alanine-synthesizing transaminase